MIYKSTSRESRSNLGTLEHSCSIEARTALFRRTVGSRHCYKAKKEVIGIWVERTSACFSELAWGYQLRKLVDKLLLQ